MNYDLSQFKKTVVRIFFWYIGLLMLFIAGSRFFGPDVDFIAYKEMIENIRYRENNKEFSFQFFLWLNDLIFYSNANVFMFMFASMSLSVKFYALFKLSRIPLISLALYIVSYFWLHEYVQIRTAIAIGFFLLSIKDLSEGNLKKYMLKVLLATLFHWSSLILIPLYFIIRYLPTKLFLYLPFMGLLIYYFGFLPSFAYSEAFLLFGPVYEITPFNLNSFMNLFLFSTSYFVFTHRASTSSSFDITLIKIFSFSYFLYCLLCALSLPIAAYRFSEYFNVIVVLIFPALIFHLRKKVILALITTLLAFTYSLRYGYILLVDVETAPVLRDVIKNLSL